MKKVSFSTLMLLSLFMMNPSLCLGVIGVGLQFDELIPRDAYDPKTIETVSGPVKEVISVPKMTGMGQAIVIKFSKPTGDIYAVIAPDWFLKNQNFGIKEGDNLKVKGSKVSFENKPVIIASEVSRQEKTLKLRDPKSGKPVWSEWRKDEEIFYKNYRW